MKQLRLILVFFLLMVGTFSAFAEYSFYTTIDGFKYRCTLNYNYTYFAYNAYVVKVPTVNNWDDTMTIPEFIQEIDMGVTTKYRVVGFDKGVELPDTWFNAVNLEVPEGFDFNGADMSKFYLLSITWLGELGPMNPNTRLKYPSKINVYYQTTTDHDFENAETYHDKGVTTVTKKSILNGDSGEGYYFEENGSEHTPAYVTYLGNSHEEVVIPDFKYDKRGIIHPVRYFGIPDTEKPENYNLKSITFEGSITLYDDFSEHYHLKKVSFKTVGDIDGICSLQGKLTHCEELEEIYFTGSTLPNLRGAATDYVYRPQNITVFISASAGVSPTELKTQDVWKTFKDIKVIGDGETRTISADARHARARLEGIQEVYDGTSYSGQVSVNSPVEIYAYPKYGDYTLSHCYVDGQDVLPQMVDKTVDNIAYKYYKISDGMSHNVRLEGEADHAMFSQLMVHQCGEGNTTIIATLNNGETRELNVPQGTGYGILDVASTDVQQVEVRFYPVNPGKPTVYNGTQQMADSDVKYYEYYKYYWIRLPLSQLQAGDFTANYPVSYAQQEGTVKTTVSVRNYSDDVIYNFSTQGDTPHNASVANNTTEDIYHKYASGGTYTISVHALSRSNFRIQENGVDVTDLAEESYYNFTYTMQHPDQNGTIIVDDGCDMRMNMTTNAAKLASFRYTDANGTQTKTFGKGQEIYAVSSKNRTGQELVVTTGVGFTLYRNGVDISDQYASSNVNADDPSKHDYHFHAYGDHNALNFVDGEDLNLVLLNAQSIPVIATSNTLDSRGIKIETFRFDESVNVDPTTLHTWGNIASAPVGGKEQLKVYFYHTNDESIGEFYINGKKYTGGYETEYMGNPESTADYFAMRFSGVGRTGYTPSEDYNSLNLEAIFISENGLDATKANAVVSMSDESKKAFAKMTYDIHREYSSETSKTETMRKGVKTFAMEKNQIDDDSYMEYKVYMPDGYEAKIYVDGVDYTGSASTSLSPTTVNGVEYNTVTLRFDSQNMPQFRTQNTSWLVSVTKSVSEVRQWNVTLLNPDKVSTDISFYDELNANKTTYERQSLLHKTITANTTVEVPYAAAAASVIVRFMNWDGTDQIYQTMADWENDYDLVVKVDGQDISDEFTDTGEYAFIANNLDPELLSATDWIVGFKEKTSTAVTHTAMLTGNIGSNQVTMQWENAQGQALSSYTVSSATPNATSTSTAQPASCRATVKLQDGYSFKAYFNGQELPAFTKSADDTYTSSFDWAVSTDGSWIFEFTKKPAEIIEFADAKVKSICVANWDTDGDGELSKVEAAAVTTLMDESNNPLFLEKASMPNKITSFNELQYFTGLTKIEEQAFMGCTKLVSIILPKTITEIDANAFNNCALLTQIVLPEGVEKIESGAFRFSGLVNIYIPKSVTTIGSMYFLYSSRVVAPIQ